ncbi:FitA-like ribbon-helix-helix domain-containing protein [Vreelandella olivaria]|uniref:FitA-like ribbon-helix-helix domain-containing protein n=1 Tax=Vreelandella olivaria TaxID=390919 RepID=UPI00201EF3E9|nr:hypothetical protein [Halomonas olivaria]
MSDKKLAMTVRGIDPDVMEALDATAQANGRTRESEVRAAIRAWVGKPDVPPGNKKKVIIPVGGLGYYAMQEEYECVLIPHEKLKNPQSQSVHKDVYILVYTSVLMNNDETRDILLNRICNTELSGIPISRVHLVLMFKETFYAESGFKAFIFEPQFDVDEARKNLPGVIQKKRAITGTEYHWRSHLIKCGDVRVYTDPEAFDELSQSAIQALLSARD